MDRIIGKVHGHRMNMFLFGYRYTLWCDVFYRCTLQSGVILVVCPVSYAKRLVQPHVSSF